MIPGDCWALVPLRGLARGKERLARVLDTAARRSLIVAMAHDVIAALLGAGVPPRQLLLVSEDDEVAALAAQLAIGVYRPAPAPADPLNAALAEALEHAAGQGAGSALLLHADLPAVSARGLAALCEAHAARAAAARATLVADRAGNGTNCLLLTPPRALPCRFGADSRARHRAAAAAAGVDYAEFMNRELALDVDFPADLHALVRLAETPDNACGAHTRAWLARHRDAIA